MIRVLHLLDQAADFQTRRGVDALAKQLGEDFNPAVKTIGRGGDFRDLLGAIRWIRRSCETNIIHAWGQTALIAAALGWRGRIVHTPHPEPGSRAVGWVRAVMSHRDVQLVLPTATLHRICIERGIPAARCHLIRPGVDFARARRRPDAALRQQLGLLQGDYVLLAAGESTEAAAHADAVWAVAILSELDPGYKLLCWGKGPRTESIKRFARHLHRPEMLHVAQENLEYEQLLPAADALLVTARGPVATLPIATGMAAGLPIVSTVTYSVAELLEDRHTALMVSTPTPRRIARRIMDLRQDASLQWSIADMAKTEAFEFFSLTRFLQQHRAIYRQIHVGEKVEVPQPPPGAGLRFHGRG